MNRAAAGVPRAFGQIGLVTRVRSIGYSEDIAGSPDLAHLLAETRTTYLPSGAVRSVKRVGIRGGSCAGADSDTTGYDVLPNGLVFQVFESNGRTVTTTYDAKNLYPTSATTQVARWVDGVPTGTFTTLTLTYETDLRTGKATRVTDPNGSAITSTFDSEGRLLTKRGPDNTLLESNVYADFYPMSVTSTITSDVGQTFQRKTRMDADGHALSVVEGAGTTAVPWSRKSKTTFDAFGRGVESYLPELVGTIDGGAAPTAGPKDVTTYDGFDRPTNVLSSDGNTTSTAYEPRSTVEVNARGISTNRTFDAFGELVTVERNPGGAVGDTSAHSFVRDGRGEILQVIDGDGSVRRFERDGGGRLLSVTLPATPGNPVTQFSMCHDLDDGLVRLESAAGRVVEVTRDELGRVVLSHASDLNGLVVDTTQSYDDPAVAKGKGRLTRKVDESGAYSLTYDTYGRPSSLVFAPSARAIAGASNVAASYTASYVYSVAGHLKTATVASGLPKTAAVVYTRDAKGRATMVESKVGATAKIMAVDLAYDAGDRLVFSRYGNNTTGEWTFNPLTERLDRVAYKTSAGDVLAAVGYVYDPNGNPLEENREREGYPGVYSFELHSYDSLDRVLQSISSSPAGYFVQDHVFSAGGNILSAAGDEYWYGSVVTSQAVTQVVNATAGTQRDLAYDPDGYLSNDSHILGDGSTSSRTLAFDPTGCMRSITRLDVPLAGPEQTSSSEYTCGLDGKVVARATTKADGSTARRIDLAGLGEIRADEGVFVLRVPVSGSVAVEDARSLATGNRVTALSGYVASDARGSVLANIELGAETTTKEAEFDAWGKKLTDFSATLSSPRHGFAGAEADEAVGSYSFGARTYDPSLRRWVSPDPLLITAPAADEDDGDDLNLFSYAGGNPTKKTDRSGYCGACEVIGVGAVIGGVARGIEYSANASTNLTAGQFLLGAAKAMGKGALEGASLGAETVLIELTAAKGIATLVRVTTSSESAAVKTATTAAKTEATAATNAAKATPASAAPKPPPAATKPPPATAAAPKAPPGKAVPNPYGCKGCAAHQAKVDAVAKDIKGRGMTPEKELKVETPGGEKGYRRIDVAAKDATGKVVEHHQVGVQNKGGTPVARESRSMADTQKATGITPTFHPYKTK